MGDQATASSKVYAKLHERLALTDHLAVLGVFISKIVANLQMRGSCYRVLMISARLTHDGGHFFS